MNIQRGPNKAKRECLYKLKEAFYFNKLIERYCGKSKNPSSLLILDVGTGWNPVIPLAMSFYFGYRIITLDVSKNLRASSIGEILEFFTSQESDKKRGK
jgi:23S rRNA A1618 N6-methylase RlmF